MTKAVFSIKRQGMVLPSEFDLCGPSHVSPQDEIGNQKINMLIWERKGCMVVSVSKHEMWLCVVEGCDVLQNNLSHSGQACGSVYVSVCETKLTVTQS